MNGDNPFYANVWAIEINADSKKDVEICGNQATWYFSGDVQSLASAYDEIEQCMTRCREINTTNQGLHFRSKSADFTYAYLVYEQECLYKLVLRLEEIFKKYNNCFSWLYQVGILKEKLTRRLSARSIDAAMASFEKEKREEEEKVIQFKKILKEGTESVMTFKGYEWIYNDSPDMREANLYDKLAITAARNNILDLLNCLKSNTSIKQLTFSYMNLNKRIIEGLNELFSTRKDFTSITFKKIFWYEDDDIVVLAKNIFANQRMLIHYEFSFAANTCYDFSKTFMRKFAIFTELRLEESDISVKRKDLSADEITFILGLLPGRRVQRLNVDGLTLISAHIQLLFEFISTSSTLQTLQFSSNQLNSELVTMLLAAIEKNNSLTNIIVVSSNDPNSNPDRALYKKLELALKKKRKKFIATIPGKAVQSEQLPKVPDYVPKEYICPITKQIMLSPVIADDGISYEEEALIGWQKNHDNSYTYPEEKSKPTACCNNNLKTAIIHYCSDIHPELWKSGAIYSSIELSNQYVQAVKDNKQDEIRRLLYIDKRLSPAWQQEESKTESAAVIPNHLKCPITGQIMMFPVVAADGKTYENEAIKKLIEAHDATISVKILNNPILLPNGNIKDAITEFLNNHPVYWESSNAIYVSAELKRGLCRAISEKNLAKIKEILTTDRRLLTLELEAGKNLLTLACSSTLEILRMTIDKLGNKFWELPEMDSDTGDGGIFFFRTAAVTLGVEGARIFKDLLGMQSTEIQEHFDYAIYTGNNILASVCLELDTNININSGYSLHRAIANNHLDTAQFLLEHKADVDMKDGFSHTALQEVASSPVCKLGYTKLLIAYGANLEILNLVGNTVILQAINDNYSGLFDLVLARNEKPANLEAKDKDGNSALHLALKLKRFDFARALIMKGAKLEALSPEGDTALLHAVKSCTAETDCSALIKLMIERGANSQAQDNNGHTMLELVCLQKNRELALLTPALKSVQEQLQAQEKIIAEQEAECQKLAQENAELNNQLQNNAVSGVKHSATEDHEKGVSTLSGGFFLQKAAMPNNNDGSVNSVANAM